MDEETYATIPETLTVRELKVHINVPGFRVQELVVVTTLTDTERYPQEEIARLFRLRWHVELDLRNIKTSLHLDDLRAKTPERIRGEIWVHWLAYNQIRKVMAQAALGHEKLPRELSFASAPGGGGRRVGTGQRGQRIDALRSCPSATPRHRFVPRRASSQPRRAPCGKTSSQTPQAADPAAGRSASDADRHARDALLG
jgi:DDE family transposase